MGLMIEVRPPTASRVSRALAAVALLFATAVDASGVLQHSASVSEANALIAEVRVSLVAPASVFVEYDSPLAGRYRTRLEAPAKEHTIPIVRLRAETTYDYTVFTVTGADQPKSVRGPSGSFTTGPLPGPLASVFRSAEGRSSQALIQSDYRMQGSGVNYFVFWDEVGALVWYLRVKHVGAVARLPETEHFLFVPWNGGLRQFTPLGKVTDLAGNIGKSHHDLIALDDGRVLLPMANPGGDFGTGAERRRILYDHLAIWHSATGHLEEVWNPKDAWDILDPAQHWQPVDEEGVQKWTHLNSVTRGRRGNFLLSFRNRSQVASLTRNYDVEWQLHGPKSDYEFPDPTDRFYGPHTASELANGNVLLFDNGWGRPDAEGGQYSRALELRLDDAAGTAVKVWEYRPNPDIYAPEVSSAYRLDSGNTLVSFGRRHRHRSQAPLVVVEADANGNEVFRVETVQFNEKPYRYRAHGGVDAIYGETMLRPPSAFVGRPPPVRLHYQRMRQVAATTFNVYMDDGHLVYAKTPCAAEDVALPFYVHLYPQRPYVLKEHWREDGFEKRDFNFFERGMRWQDRCHAEVALPEYAIDRIATGQLATEGGEIDGRQRPNEPLASATRRPAGWAAEIRVAPGEGDSPDVLGHDASGSASVLQHSVEQSVSNALIAELSVSLAGSAAVFVEYDNPIAGRYRTRSQAPATEHLIPIVRLRPETTYDYTIFVVDGAEKSDAARGPSGSFTTGSLPEPLASVFTTAVGRSSQPLILSDYRLPESHLNGQDYFIFWDEVGALVWYVRVEDSGPVARASGGENFLFVPWTGGLEQFTPLGKVTDLAGHVLDKSHHELVPLDADRILLPLSVSEDFGSDEDPKQIVYDDLAIWHSATGRIEKAWSARESWDIMDPAQHWEPVDEEGRQRWTHLNSVSPTSEGNLLLSFRHRSQIVSLTPDYEIEWQLHGPDSDYDFPDPTDRFYGPHTASQLANGNILVFDNGRGRPDAEGGLYSRALELRLDDAAGTAVKVWEYRPDPDIYSTAVSSAYRLENGNTLVNFGVRKLRLVHSPLVVVEADANGDEVFRVETAQFNQTSVRYRAHGGIEAIYGETMLRPPTEFVQRPPSMRLHYERMEKMATSTFDLYLDDRHLVYAKAPCAAEDLSRPFFLHVVPKKLYVLAEDRRKAGFDNLDYHFFLSGVRWQGRCHVEVRLPDYEIDHVATGQGVVENDATDDRDPNEAGESGAWRVEIVPNEQGS